MRVGDGDLLVGGLAQAEPVARPFVVVLDAGHGGSNTGAAGVVEGVYEKRVTLALARAVATRLGREPELVVKLTRTDDRYLTLRERVRLANAAGADIFVSVHANASPATGQRGFETYVLTPEALDVDTPRPPRRRRRRRVPASTRRWPCSSTISSAAPPQPGPCASPPRIQVRLQEVRGSDGNRGVQPGLAWTCSSAPTMPAVLVEVGFIDHAFEGTELLAPRDA